jgi:ATP-binding cassette subfamily B protein
MLRRQYESRLGAEVLALVVSAAALVWMIRQALLGRVTLGDLALFYQAFQRGQGVIRALLGNVGQIYTNSLFLGNLFEFLELRSTVVEPPNPLPVPPFLRIGLAFRSVTFRYPGSDRVALRDFSLTIPAGKIVAIVGANGAGKSTLLKLLCRFYDPDDGRVELDGIDLRRLSLSELRRRITFMLQLPIHYQATVRENIALGSLADDPTIEGVRDAARAADVDDTIARLPRKYETLLGKWFAEGTELSAGEWQRVAMARAFLRKGEIILLDEPTSMMDSWSETAWFDRLRQLATGRTAVLITHRLTIAARSDLIYVMMNGEIAESGTHEELLAGGGEYARSWNAQVRSDAAPAAPLTPT